MQATNDERLRNYATIVYPDSAPDNWMGILGEMCIPAYVSPLHDKDKNPHGESKKPHYHVLLAFDGKKSLKQVVEIISQINGVGCEKVLSLRGYARYLCHLDNPEKTQYSVEDVCCFGGADILSAISLPVDKYKILIDIMQFVDDNCLYSYAKLLQYCRDNRMDWFRVLCDSGTYVIKEYLKSRFWDDNNAVT